MKVETAGRCWAAREEGLGGAGPSAWERVGLLESGPGERRELGHGMKEKGMGWAGLGWAESSRLGLFWTGLGKKGKGVMGRTGL